MDNYGRERIEGLEPRELFRRALGDPTGDPASAERAAEEELGIRTEIESRLPDLEILELLGRGGMGYVYRVHQKKLNREVALKVVAPSAERETDFAERFAREAQAMARLNHPNIVSVYDYGQEGPLYWLLMEYVDGSNLRDVIRGGVLEPREALTLIPKICDALQYAHDNGVVHRDVKPENILLDRNGSVKIADFGLAKLTGTPAVVVALTGSQQVLGTLRYMAPEQLDRPLEVDHRADIYALGVVFYEILTGEIPMGRFDPPSLRSAAPPKLDHIVLRALAKEPERRYQQAADVKSDIQSVERGELPPLAASDREPTTASIAPQVSPHAVMSTVLFGLGMVPLLITIVSLFVVANVDAPVSVQFEVSFAGLILLLTGAIGLGLMIAGSAIGFRALTLIRDAWPQFYGVGAALVGAWAGPLLAANVVILAVTVLIIVALSPISVVIGMLMLLVCDAAILSWYRRRFLERCGA